jgi:hypothetical protein
MTPLSADKVLDHYFLEARARLLDLAAFLDRLDRGGAITDPRLTNIQQALAVLQTRSGGRAEAVQQLFSWEYDPNWVRPDPR